MKNENYQISITVNADEQKAFENICNVTAWWAGKVIGTTHNLNDEFTIDWGETFVKFKITTFRAYTNIAWTVTDCFLPWLENKKEWNDTIVEWTITQKNEQVKIAMTHIGLTPAIECYNNCEQGWNFYAGKSLLKFINEGKGLPDTPNIERAA
jgi:hypothetical protein